MAPSAIEIVGSLNTDLVTVTPRVPGPGETLAATSFATGFGGKGANQAVACARLCRSSASDPLEQGTRVAMRGAVGDDQFGTDMLKHLEAERIDCSGIKVKPGQSTGTAIILVEEGSGENRILYTAGANAQLQADNVEFYCRDAGAHLSIFQLETPLETVVECIKRAKALGNQVLLNPAPASVLPEQIYANIDHLVLNESEASILSGVSEKKLSESLDTVAKTFCSKGVQNVVITLGANGVFTQTQSAAQNGKQGQIVKAHKVKVVDTTAAGDTFVGAYASYLARNGFDEVVPAVKFANLAASKTVQKAGAQASIPFLGQVS